MNCIEFEIAAELAVERRQSLDLAALGHAQTCASCRQIWEQNQRLDAVIAAWQTAEVPSGFVDSVLAAIRSPVSADNWDDDAATEQLIDHFDDGTFQESRREEPIVRPMARNNIRSSRPAIASVAACLFVVATFFAISSTGSRSIDLAHGHRSRPVGQGTSGAPLNLSVALTAVLSDLRSEYNEVASETTTAAREMVNAIPRPSVVSILPDGDEIQLHPNSNDMVRIWKPIGSQVETALGFLWQAVPSEIPSG